MRYWEQNSLIALAPFSPAQTGPDVAIISSEFPRDIPKLPPGAAAWFDFRAAARHNVPTTVHHAAVVAPAAPPRA
jgi:hypothetical protein